MNDGAGDLLVLGKTGQGKSTWVQGYNAGLDRVLAWDPKRQYRNCEFREDLRDFFSLKSPPRSESELYFLNMLKTDDAACSS